MIVQRSMHLCELDLFRPAQSFIAGAFSHISRSRAHLSNCSTYLCVSLDKFIFILLALNYISVMQSNCLGWKQYLLINFSLHTSVMSDDDECAP